MTFFTCISHPILARVRCISADIQRPRADIGCDIKNAMSLFLYHILIENIKETITNIIR